MEGGGKRRPWGTRNRKLEIVLTPNVFSGDLRNWCLNKVVILSIYTMKKPETDFLYP